MKKFLITRYARPLFRQDIPIEFRVFWSNKKNHAYVFIENELIIVFQWTRRFAKKIEEKLHCLTFVNQNFKKCVNMF